jgi:hypothetical protein
MPVRPADHLYKAALPEDNLRDLHRIFWLPGSPLERQGSNVTDCVNTELIQELLPAKSLKLRKLAASTAGSAITAAGPAAAAIRHNWTAWQDAISPNNNTGNKGLIVTVALTKDGKVVQTLEGVEGPVQSWQKAYEAIVPGGLKEVIPLLKKAASVHLSRSQAVPEVSSH